MILGKGLTTKAMEGSAEKGASFLVVDPVTGLKTDFEITVKGKDSLTYRDAAKAASKKMASKLDGKKELTNDEAILAGVEMIAPCISSWSGVKDENEKDIDCTIENVKKYLIEYKWLADQVIKAMENRSLFFYE